MTDPQRFRKVAELFEAARQRSPDTRAAFLDEACEGNSELRAEIDALLAEHDSYSPLDQGTPAITIGHLAAPADLGDEPVPERIGRYTIVGRIGKGGMGTVYEATQENPRRTVALKVMHPGFVSRRMLSRFQLEAHLLGQLQHPGIAHIYEAGTTDESAGGQPFFAMELIRGGTLTEHARDSNLDTRARLELMARICDAVQHAHQRGVIHRDLKPSNILVNENGQPKILDFGVARATDADLQMVTMQTEVGQLIGTLPYMSPEQVIGDPAELDIRLDVYALGVILYELLADKLPLNVSGRSIADAVHAIRESEPPRLRSINTTLRGDLDTIVAKAMEKDKERRYQSAADLAADIRRFLHDQPIAARPASTLYQLRKFARRHKAATIAGVTILLAMAGATAFSSVYAYRAEHARQETQRQAEIASAINQFLNDDLLASVAPSASRDAGRGRDVRMSEVLQEAARRIDAACAPGGAFEHKPEVEAAIRLTLGRTLTALGDHDAAFPHLTRSYSLRKQHLGQGHVETLSAATNLAGNLFRRSELDASVTVLEEALPAGRTAHGADHPLVLACEVSYANVFWRRGEYEQALQLLNHVFETRRRTLGPDHSETLAASKNLALVYKRLRRYDEAETIERRVLAHNEEELGEDHPDTLRIAHNIGTTLFYAKNYDAAEAQWRAVLEQRRLVLGPDHHETLSTCLNLGSALVEQGRSAEAEPVYRAGYDATLARYGESSEMLMNFAFGLANSLRDQGRFDEAEPLYQDTIRTREASIGLGRRETTQVVLGLFDMRMMQGRTKEAEEILTRSVAALLEAGQLAHNARLVESLIECRVKLGMYAEALNLVRAYDAAVANAHGPESEEAVRVRELKAEIEQLSADSASLLEP